MNVRISEVDRKILDDRKLSSQTAIALPGRNNEPNHNNHTIIAGTVAIKAYYTSLKKKYQPSIFQ